MYELYTNIRRPDTVAPREKVCLVDPVDVVVAALAAQQAELTELLADLAPERWSSPTRCEGWDVADVVIHLIQTNEMAVGSAHGVYEATVARLADGLAASGSVDEGAARMVARARGATPAELVRQWTLGAAELVEALNGIDLSTRVTWVAGQLSARTLATTRIAETWIHAGDVAGAVGVTLPDTDRLRHIAHLAWRTLPYAFARDGKSLRGPVAFRLAGPAGDPWDFMPDDSPVTTIVGPAGELCAVAARRRDPTTTSLWGEGPDAADVLALVRTYA